MAIKKNFPLGVKTDPIEYRYSYEWLFRILAEEEVRHIQLGSFFELYQLEDDYFLKLRRLAEEFGLSISSMFTAHRELGGFFAGDPAWEKVARSNYERYIEVGALLGAKHVGSNPGAALRDQMGRKAEGIECYLKHMKELLHFAHEKGVACLTIEPMSCHAEPPTLPEEIQYMAETLSAYHAENSDTAAIGYCADIAHGLADKSGTVLFDHTQLFEATFPWLVECHIKNTDAEFNSTFGFAEEDRARGIVDLAAVRDALHAATNLPGDTVTAYLEIGGPKLGRDYSDPQLEEQLRASLRYVKEVFGAEASVISNQPDKPIELTTPGSKVRISPSLMCCDLCHFEESVRKLEALDMSLLHIDIMDAHFTPNMPLGLEIFKQLRKKTGLPFDAHLMVDRNEFFVEQMAEIGVQMVSVHVEECDHLDRVLSRIRDLGMQAGAALNPATPLSALEYVLDRLDFVVIMTVNPGFAGQALVPSGIRKIAECRAFLDSHGRDIPIEVDGNVSFENIPKMVAAGADILVAGTSSIFHKDATMIENTLKTRQLITEGLAGRG